MTARQVTARQVTARQVTARQVTARQVTARQVTAQRRLLDYLVTVKQSLAVTIAGVCTLCRKTTFRSKNRFGQHVKKAALAE